MAIITLSKVSKQFTVPDRPPVIALEKVDLRVEKAEVISIIGPSGGGKSTLLRVINQLEVLDSGEIAINEQPVIAKNAGGAGKRLNRSKVKGLLQKTGMVFQHFHLFPHKTVLENLIEGPIIVKKTARKTAVGEAERLLERVGLADKRNSYSNQLSGGQKQRVAIARALSMRPEVLLCDEPTSSLDPEMIGEVVDVLRDLAHRMTMLIVTHDIGLARQISNRIVFIEHGKIVESGSPEQIIEQPRHPRIRDFIDKIL